MHNWLPLLIKKIKIDPERVLRPGYFDEVLLISNGSQGYDLLT